MTKTAIRATAIGKEYHIGAPSERYKTIRESLTGLLSAPFRRAGKLLRGQSYGASEMDEIFWALKDISFEVKQGEVVGIIGRNGAGKSTLLKILSRITPPSTGQAEIHGRIGSLLEVGTGFHPELTGRENIYLNGNILGMKKREIDRKLSEIIDFSGVEKFIDTPVKHYSSGMHVRLAFSVAAHLEPEILLVDEVLAVGDVAFQKKCLQKMKNVTKQGRTILFVSHNMAAIRNLCPRTMLLEDGKLVLDAESEQVISSYLDQNLTEGAVATFNEVDLRVEHFSNDDNVSMVLKKIALIDEEGMPRNIYRSDEPFKIIITYECLSEIIDLRLIIKIVDEDNQPILVSQNVDSPDNFEFYRHGPGLYQSICHVPPNIFGEKRFYISVGFLKPRIEYLDLIKGLWFEITFQGYNNVQYDNWKESVLRPLLPWETKTIEKNQEKPVG